MSDLERELANRLARLGDAVPVAPANLDRVHLRAVETRRAVRMSWVTPLVVLVVVVAFSGIIGIGPFAPGLSNSPVSATAIQGPFNLTIRSAKRVYTAGEPIQIGATLAYAGPQGTVQISYAPGAAGTPIGFGIAEPVEVPGVGLISLSDDVRRLSCVLSKFDRSVPFMEPFAKAGVPADPAERPPLDALDAYFRDRTLTLPPGIWHPYAVAAFDLGSCGAPGIELRADIEIRVVPDSASPSPSAGSFLPSEATVASDRSGDFELALQANKHVYAPDEPIDVTGSVTYLGSSKDVQISTADNGPIAFGIREHVFGAIEVGEINGLTCKQTTLAGDQPLVEPFQKGGAFDGENPDASQFEAFFADPELRLPKGTWHIYAMSAGPCMGQGPAFDLTAEIEIVVDSNPNATPGQPVATDWQDKPVYGGDDIGNMGLQVRSAHPTYQLGTPIDLTTWYTFAEGPQLALSPFVQDVAWSIVQDDPAAVVVRSIEADPGCVTTTLSDLEQRNVAPDDANVVLIKAASWPATSADALKRGVLDLPVGHWRITAVVRALFGPCGRPDTTWEVHASVDVDVVPSS